MSGERIEGRNANDYNIQQLVPVLPLCTVWECHLPPRGEPLTAKEEAYFSLTSRPDWKISNDHCQRWGGAASGASQLPLTLSLDHCTFGHNAIPSTFKNLNLYRIEFEFSKTLFKPFKQ